MTQRNRQSTRERKPAPPPSEDAADTKAAELRRKPRDPNAEIADDTIEGEGSPGLTITGGGGHA
jgi:hypothetical protein